jgi:hypothetical protein
MTLDQIVIVVLAIIMVVSTAFSFVLVKRIDQLNSKLWQAELDKGELMKQLYQEFQKNSTPNPNDSFVKFLTESRSSAFDYIENAQKTIMEFLVISDKMPVAKTATKEQVQTYKDACNKLIDLLPVVNEND